MTQQEAAAEVFERMAEDQDIQAKIEEAMKWQEVMKSIDTLDARTTTMHLNYMFSVIANYRRRIESLSKQLYDLSVQPNSVCPECGEDGMEVLDGVYGCAACGHCPVHQDLGATDKNIAGATDCQGVL